MTKKTSKKASAYSKQKTLTVLKISMVYIVAYMLSIIVMDAWNVTTEDATNWRWVASSLLLVVNLGVWWSVKINGTIKHQTMLVLSLILAQLLFAGINIYWQRGMASVSAVMFAVPILISGVLADRKLLYLTAGASALMYSSMVYKYFYDFYGEGYLAQMWVTLGFFSVLFMIVAWLLDTVLDLKKK